MSVLVHKCGACGRVWATRRGADLCCGGASQPECRGCKARDGLIQTLAERIDYLEQQRDESMEKMAQALGEWGRSLMAS